MRRTNYEWRARGDSPLGSISKGTSFQNRKRPRRTEKNSLRLRVQLNCLHAPVAQWIEHLASNQRVGGSSPSGRASTFLSMILQARVWKGSKSTKIHGPRVFVEKLKSELCSNTRLLNLSAGLFNSEMGPHSKGACSVRCLSRHRWPVVLWFVRPLRPDHRCRTEPCPRAESSC
jgi:hypothetical protein